MILVDTSVWINYFNGNINEEIDKLVNYLKLGKNIFITDIILTEIL